MLAIILVMVAILFPPQSAIQTEERSTIRSGPTRKTTPPPTSTRPTVTFTTENWHILQSDPNRYSGAHAKIAGKVFMEPHREGENLLLQIWAPPDDRDRSTVVLWRNPTLDIRDGDFVMVTGMTIGTYTFKTITGVEIEPIVVLADSVEIMNPFD